MNKICNDKYDLIKKLGSGAFGEVFEIFNKELNIFTAIKISKSSTNELELEHEIRIIKKLTNLNTPCVTRYLGDGYCPLLNNKRYYEMTLANVLITDVMQHELSKHELYNIMFELLYTLAYFRQINFKHRDLSIFNILCNTNVLPRIYTIGKVDFTIFLKYNLLSVILIPLYLNHQMLIILWIIMIV